MAECEHIIGFLNEEYNTDVITVFGLKLHLIYLKTVYEKSLHKSGFYEAADYCDKDKEVDLYRFNYCPKCGKEIDWCNLFDNHSTAENII